MKRKTKAVVEAPMIHVGASEQSVAATLKAVTTILDYKDHTPDVLVMALRVLKKGCTVQNVTISNSTLTRRS